MDRTLRGYLIAGFLLSIAFGSQPSEAQYVADYQTNIITGGTSTWSGPYIVGSNTMTDALLIVGKGVLSSGGGYLGYTSASSNNGVFVTGTGSVWNAGHLYTGYSGAGNSLVVRSGGQIVKGVLYVGYNVSSSDNSVLITDPGSVWNSDDVGDSYFGYSGAGNSLIISNGGSVSLNSAYQSFVGYNTSSSNNSVVVTGLGSVLTSLQYFGYGGSGNSLVVSSGGKLNDFFGVFNLGFFNQGNSLVVSNGGQVFDGEGSVGNGSTSSSNNSVLVTGAGSVWSNGYTFEVGGLGAHNSLVISNGGLEVDIIGQVGFYTTVRVADGAVWRNKSLSVGNQGSSNSLFIAGGAVYATNLVVGVGVPTCDNLIELNSGSLIVTNTAASGVLNVQHGELIVNGGLLQVDTLVITNSCSSFLHTGGTLVIRKMVLDPNSFHILAITPQGNDVLVTWMMGPGATNTLQAAAGDASGGYSTNGFTDIFTVTNNTTVGTVTNYLDLGAATNAPARYYRARLVP